MPCRAMRRIGDTGTLGMCTLCTLCTSCTSCCVASMCTSCCVASTRKSGGCMHTACEQHQTTYTVVSNFPCFASIQYGPQSRHTAYQNTSAMHACHLSVCTAAVQASLVGVGAYDRLINIHPSVRPSMHPCIHAYYYGTVYNITLCKTVPK